MQSCNTHNGTYKVRKRIPGEALLKTPTTMDNHPTVHNAEKLDDCSHHSILPFPNIEPKPSNFAAQGQATISGFNSQAWWFNMLLTCTTRAHRARSASVSATAYRMLRLDIKSQRFETMMSGRQARICKTRVGTMASADNVVSVRRHEVFLQEQPFQRIRSCARLRCRGKLAPQID